MVVAEDFPVAEVTALIDGGTGLGNWAVEESIVRVATGCSVWTSGWAVNTGFGFTVDGTLTNDFGWVQFAASLWINTLVSKGSIFTIDCGCIKTAFVLASI